MHSRFLSRIEIQKTLKIKLSVIGFCDSASQQFIDIFQAHKCQSLSLLSNEVMSVSSAVVLGSDVTTIIAFLCLDLNCNFKEYRSEMFTDSDAAVVVLDDSNEGLNTFYLILPEFESHLFQSFKKLLVIFSVS